MRPPIDDRPDLLLLLKVPTEGEVWISTSWDKYHPWEDGRGNYAWDLGALNSNMMSYSGYGTRNSDYEVFGKTVICPMYGRVVTVERDVSSVFISLGISHRGT